MEWQCLVFDDGRLEEPIPSRLLWDGDCSRAHTRSDDSNY
jgi:hypothetical protein